MSYFTQDETNYMNWLEEIYDAPNYGLLLRNGDPIAFEVGMQDWLKRENS